MKEVRGISYDEHTALLNDRAELEELKNSVVVGVKEQNCVKVISCNNGMHYTETYLKQDVLESSDLGKTLIDINRDNINLKLELEAEETKVETLKNAVKELDDRVNAPLWWIARERFVNLFKDKSHE